MLRTRIKICGITRREDAEAAAALGADAIGLVFYPQSSRSVDIVQAREIVRALPPFLSIVGLFVNADEKYVIEVREAISLDLLQFHGEESPEQCSRFSCPYIKALKMRESADILQLAKQYHDACAILLDTYIEGIAGGSGEVFDWHRVPAGLDKPVILAGGLNPANVAAAINTVRPFAVDVSGGVEVKKGIKSYATMQAFIQEVNYASA